MVTDEHSVYLPPSGAPIWGHCSGAPMAQVGMPNPDTEDTREGTAAHWVMGETLEEAKNGITDDCSVFLNISAPNGVLIDDKIVEGAQVIVDDVLEVCRRFDCLQDLLVEHRVAMPKIHPENWGRLDAALYLRHRKVIFLWDYKHGHRDNSPIGHLQMIDYVQGLVEEFQIDGLQEQEITVVIRIVQPFCYYARGPVKEWAVRLSDLRAYWNTLSMKAYEAFSDPKLTTGLWCRDCLARRPCAANRRARYNFIEEVNAPYEMDEMNGADLAVERQILEDGIAVAKKRLEAIEDELEHRVRSGETDSGLALEAIEGRENWAVPPAQAKALFAQFDTDISKEGVLTPKQSLKKVPVAMRPLAASILKQFTKTKSAITLVPVDESRTARAFKRKTEQ